MTLCRYDLDTQAITKAYAEQVMVFPTAPVLPYLKSLGLVRLGHHVGPQFEVTLDFFIGPAQRAAHLPNIFLHYQNLL